MTSCPRVYTYPPLYSSIECYQVCSSRHSLVWMVRLHSGRWGDSGAVHALYRGRNCGRGGSNVILNGIISRTRSLARSPSAIQRLFDFGVLGFSFSYWTSPPGDPVVPTLFSLSLFVCHMFWVMLFWCEFFYRLWCQLRCWDIQPWKVQAQWQRERQWLRLRVRLRIGLGLRLR